MPVDMRQAVSGALTIGMFIALLDLTINPANTPVTPLQQEITVSFITAGDEVVEQFNEKSTSVSITVSDNTPKKLWGLPGPVLKPCWGKLIAYRQKRTQGYVMVKLSSNPLYHPLQVADAVIIARSLGATLVLPKLRESVGFNKLYDVDNFVSSLRGVIQVVSHLPAELRTVKPALIKVPYRVTPEYINVEVKPIFSEKHVIQVSTVFSTLSPSVEDPSTGEIQVIRCLVMYNALRFHSKVKELGERVVNSLRAMSGSDHFIAVDLRLDMLKQTGCRQPKTARSKRCFDASAVATFLKRLGFSSGAPIYLTQSRWDQSLDVLKDIFPRVYTKDRIQLVTEDKQAVQQTELAKALDLYVCTHSDVFVPAISGISYVNIASNRIIEGRTQILVPTVSDKGTSSELQLSRVMSRFVTKKDHAVYSCFCKHPSNLPHKLNRENSEE